MGAASVPRQGRKNIPQLGRGRVGKVAEEHPRHSLIDNMPRHPTLFGLPALAVLDDHGKLLTVQDSGKLELGDHHDPEKVSASLRQWAEEECRLGGRGTIRSITAESRLARAVS